jgi:hypothetical protein
MSKVTKKTAKKVIAKKGRPKSEFPRGYKVEAINKQLTLGGVTDLYEVYVVEHKNLPAPKTFVDKESVQKFINVMEGNKVEAKALSLKGYQHVKGVVSQHKEAMVAPEMEEIAKVLGY